MHGHKVAQYMDSSGCTMYGQQVLLVLPNFPYIDQVAQCMVIKLHNTWTRQVAQCMDNKCS